jgi:signal transduction histidine kinase
MATRTDLFRPGRSPRWIAALVLLALVSPAVEALAAQKQVLVLYATRRDAQVAVLADRELPTMLEDLLGEKLDYYAEYLDLARFPGVGYQSAVRDFLQVKYKDQTFDLVVAMHDVALQFLLTYRADLFPGVPIVFSSTNPNVRRPANATGLMAPNEFGKTVALAGQLQPNLRRVVVVSGADRRDADLVRQARAQLEPLAGRYTFTYLSGLPTGELQRRLAELPRDAIVYYLLVNRDGNGDTFHPLDYLDRVVRAASVPVYSWVDSAMGRGTVGGDMRSQTLQIELVGQLATRVLRGEAADSIPVLSADVTVPQVDWRQLRRWGIADSRVPPGTVVLFEAPTVWDRYKRYIIGAVVLMVAQTALIGALLIQRQRRRKAEGQVRESQSELKVSYDRIRSLAARLLSAHEEERARVARDLHDDISQQLALLWNDLQMVSGLSEGETEAAADRALQRLDGVTRSVREVSHRLHPAKLLLMGLVPSLQALQREVGTSGPELRVEHEHVPPILAPELALCLYRVVQEALQNAVRHGRAGHVHVRLVGTADQIRLEVEDDGIGFDPGRPGSAGLGLLSMRERIEAVGGCIEIVSRPGAGTQLRVEAPLASGAPEPLAL